MKCELCKCLNLVAEGRKHPSQTTWTILNLKYNEILNRSPKSLNSFCVDHRIPLKLIADVSSVGEFIDEVYGAAVDFLKTKGGVKL